MKSQLDFYVELCAHLLASNPLSCHVASETFERDISTVRLRCKHEGISFLTKTLPKLGKALDRGLETSHFVCPREFSQLSGHRGFPEFLQGAFKYVFTPHGELRDDVEINVQVGAIRLVRQVTFFAYKLQIPFEKEESDSVINSFVSCESELYEQPESQFSKNVLNVSRNLALDVFCDFDHRDIVPRHGPGAVATGERLEDKWEFSRLYRGIHQVYPYYDYFVAGGSRELLDRKAWYDSLKRCDYGVAKVVLVPKDSRGPRLISAEPLEYQYIQQGLGRKLMQHLEASRLTRGNINFTSQSINRDLALSSSVTKSMATLDLKDASDRVSTWLVKDIFHYVKDLRRALLASRTSFTRLPDGRVIPLRKFAPMGSALCFPIEAFVFWSLITCGVALQQGVLPTEVGKHVYVYGDDIVVPTEWAHASMDVLELFHLKVNRDKSFIKGNFRESCGMDAFKGFSVTPIRLTTLWGGKPSDGSVYASYTAKANLLSLAGYVSAASYLYQKIESLFGVLPYGTIRSSYPCKITTTPSRAELLNRSLGIRSRWNGNLQRIEFLTLGLKSRMSVTKLDGWTRLLARLVVPGVEDPSHVVLPRSTKIKRGWRPVL